MASWGLLIRVWALAARSGSSFTRDLTLLGSLPAAPPRRPRTPLAKAGGGWESPRPWPNLPPRDVTPPGGLPRLTMPRPRAPLPSSGGLPLPWLSIQLGRRPLPRYAIGTLGNGRGSRRLCAGGLSLGLSRFGEEVTGGGERMLSRGEMYAVELCHSPCVGRSACGVDGSGSGCGGGSGGFSSARMLGSCARVVARSRCLRGGEGGAAGCAAAAGATGAMGAWPFGETYDRPECVS